MRTTGDNMADVRRTNRSAALKLLHENGAMSRKRLAEQMRLTPAAISKIVAELMGEGLVAEGAALPRGRAGRREVLLSLVPDARCALGIYLDLRRAIVSGVRLDGSVLFSEEIALPERANADETVAMLCAHLLARAENLPRAQIVGIGVAVRGITDASGRISRNNMGALREADYPLAEKVHLCSGLPVVMDNNVRALFAAHRFIAREQDAGAQFFLRCEYGIGAALSTGDAIWPGSSGQCAELGHIPVVRRGGKVCACGKRGCLETVASPMALLADARALLDADRAPLLRQLVERREGGEMTLDDVLLAAGGGDDDVAALVRRAVRALGGALKSVIYLLDPGQIVLYGHIFRNDYFLSALLAEMHEGVDPGRRVRIAPSPYNGQLEESAAGLLAVEDFIRRGGAI